MVTGCWIISCITSRSTMAEEMMQFAPADMRCINDTGARPTAQGPCHAVASGKQPADEAELAGAAWPSQRECCTIL